jgi:hypothetical protein
MSLCIIDKTVSTEQAGSENNVPACVWHVPCPSIGRAIDKSNWVYSLIVLTPTGQMPE